MDVKSADLLTAIYCLRDPRDGRIRYIGKAEDPEDRLREHLEQSSKARSHKASWVRSLKRAGQRPVLEVLEWVPATDWRSAERAWIQYGRWSSWPLTNGTEGGEGGTIAASWSHEAREKRRATTERNGTALNGQRAMAAARRGGGKPLGSGSKPGVATVRGSEVGTSKLTEADVVHIRRLLADNSTGVEVAQAFGVSPQMISLIRTRRAWQHVD